MSKNCPTIINKNITIVNEETVITHYENYKSTKIVYTYICNKCGYSGEITKSNLTQGKGCSCCNGKTVAEGINDIPTTAPEMVKYFQGGYDEAKLYTKGSSKRIIPICPDCKKIKDKDMKIITLYSQGMGCDCGDGTSFPEKIMISLLKSLNLDYIKEYSPNWIKPKRYDFLITNKNIIIEMDGALHYKDNPYNGEKLEKTKNSDMLKDFMAIKNGYKIIRIDCRYSGFEYIKKNILQSQLNEIYELNEIDWGIIHENSLSNLAKMVCDYRKNTSEKTSDIASKFNIAICSTINYLKLGNDFGWCEYDPKIEAFKGSFKSGKQKGKKVSLYDKDLFYIGKFSSLVELEKYSLNNLEVILKSRSIGEKLKSEDICHYNNYIIKKMK